MNEPIDAYVFLRAWEERQTTRLPTAADWPELKRRLQAIAKAAREAEQRGDSIYLPPRNSTP
jgi:hypothetical protein